MTVRYSLFFCSYCPAHLPALHSFPTRRSSDLIVSCSQGSPVCLFRMPPQRSTTFSPRRKAQQAPPASPRRAKRSEEHTSELQSLTNLVCRLLLEKKKKKTTTYQ